MNIYEFIQRRVYNPFDNRFRWYDQFMANTCKTRDEILDIQNHDCQTLLEHAYDTSPFYQKRFSACGICREDITGVTTLDKLPPLTKADLRQHEDEIKSTNPAFRKMMRVTSGGSTGTLSVIRKSRHFNGAKLRVCYAQLGNSRLAARR